MVLVDYSLSFGNGVNGLFTIISLILKEGWYNFPDFYLLKNYFNFNTQEATLIVFLTNFIF
jgi:hypothetical protein